MEHAHKLLLQKMYSNYSNGNLKEFLADCSDEITFQVLGKSKLAGKYTKDTFLSDFFPRLAELSGGTFKTEVHDILASDRHGAVLVSHHLERGGKSLQIRSVNIWRFENAKPVAWYEYPRDLYQFDELLS